MIVYIFGKGYIGSKLEKYLSSKGHIVYLLAKAQVDYTNFFELSSFFQGRSKPHYVINASGYTGIPNVDAAENEKDLCWKYNVEVPSVLASAIEVNKFGYLIHLSSGCIYNGYEKEYTEEDTPNFGLFNSDSSFYSKTKHAAETILKNYPSYILRIRIPFSSENHSKNYFNKLFKYNKLIDEKNSLTCIDDLCWFIHELMNKKNYHKSPYGIYNVVNSGYAKASDVMRLMEKYGKVKTDKYEFIKLNELDTLAKRSNVILSTDKIKSEYLELPNVMTSLEKCIREWNNGSLDS